MIEELEAAITLLKQKQKMTLVEQDRIIRLLQHILKEKQTEQTATPSHTQAYHDARRYY